MPDDPGYDRLLRTSLAQEATAAIREKLVSGVYRGGERLIEARLAADLGVSRGPVREALQLLAAEGFVRDEPGRGAYVATVTPEDVADIYDLRAAIEGHAAGRLAHSGSAQLGDLERILQSMRQAAGQSDRRTLRNADLAFHEAVCRLSGNHRIHDAFLRYVPLVEALLPLDERFYPDPKDIEGQHRRLLEALLSGDKTLAMAAFVEHAEEASVMVVRHLEDEARAAAGDQSGQSASN